jgi:hypothetical protein
VSLHNAFLVTVAYNKETIFVRENMSKYEYLTNLLKYVITQVTVETQYIT